MLRLSVLTLLLFAAFEASAWKHKDYMDDGECQLFPNPMKDKYGNHEWTFTVVLQNIEDAQCCAHLRTYLEGAFARGLTMDRAWFAAYGQKDLYLDSCRVEDGACGDSPPSFQDGNPGEPLYVADNDAMAKAQAYICSKPSCSYGPDVAYITKPHEGGVHSMICEGETKYVCDMDVNKNFCADVLKCGQDDPFVPFDDAAWAKGQGLLITGRTNVNGVVLRAGDTMAYSEWPHLRPVFDYFNTNSAEMFACDRTDNQHYAEVPIGSGIVPDRNFGQLATKKELLGCSDRDVNAVVKRQVARVSGALESVGREIRLMSNSLVGHHAAKEERPTPPALCPSAGQGTSSTTCRTCVGAYVPFAERQVVCGLCPPEQPPEVSPTEAFCASAATDTTAAIFAECGKHAKGEDSLLTMPSCIKAQGGDTGDVLAEFSVLCPAGTEGTACSICLGGITHRPVNRTQFPSGTLEFNAENGAAVLDETGAWIPWFAAGPAGWQRPPKVKNAGEITVQTTLHEADPAFDQNDFVAVNGFNADGRDHTTVIERTARFTVKEGYYYTYGVNGSVTEDYLYQGHETCWNPGDGAFTFVTAHGQIADDDVFGWYRPGSSNYVADRTVLTDYEFQAPLKDNFVAGIKSSLTMTVIYMFASPSGVYSITPGWKYTANYGANAILGSGTNFAADGLKPLDGTSDCSPPDEPLGPTWGPYRCNEDGGCNMRYSEPLHFTGEAGGVTFVNTFMGRFSSTIAPDASLIGSFISTLVLSPSSMVLLVDDLGRFVTGSTEAIDEVFEESSAGGLANRQNKPFLNCMGQVTAYTAALQDQDGMTGEWQAVMDDVGAVGKAGDVVTSSRDFTVTRWGSGPTNHHFSYYVFPESGEDGFKLPPWVLLALVPRVELDAAADWKMESKVVAATSAEHPVEAVGATFSIENTGLVDLVFTIEDLPGWARIEWANGTDFELGKGHTIAGDFQYGEFATPNEKAELRIFFTGTGEEHKVLLAPMTVLVADDGFPDCFKEVTQSVALEFDFSYDPTSTKKIPAWVPYLIVPLGLLLAVGVLFYVARRQEQTIEKLAELLSRSATNVASLTFETMDIVSDTFVVVQIFTNDELEKYLVPYALFFGLGLAMYFAATVSNVTSLHYLLTRKPALATDALGGAYSEAANAALEISVKLMAGGQDDLGSKGAAVAKMAVARRDSISAAKMAQQKGHDQPSSARLVGELQADLVNHHQEYKIRKQILRHVLGTVGLLLLEDIPMSGLGVVMLIETRKDMETATFVTVLVGLVMGVVMVGLKSATVASVPTKMSSLTSVKWDLVLTAKEIRIQKEAEKSGPARPSLAATGQGLSTFSISME